MMFPILKQTNRRVALGYLSAGLVEAAVITMSRLYCLLQIPLGVEFLKASASEIPYLQSLGALFVQSQAYTYQIQRMFALGMASLTLCSGFYHAELVPQPFVIRALWVRQLPARFHVGVWASTSNCSTPFGRSVGMSHRRVAFDRKRIQFNCVRFGLPKIKQIDLEHN
ncbi:MAG: DUF4386 domain-containing protein [Anaerolineales bacterium]|nr:DUF4386 domain-containing protein [Anaerolineales bacterium]